MTKESSFRSKQGLLAATALGAAEGAVIGSFSAPPASSIFGMLLGGATAFTTELGMRAAFNNTTPKEPAIATIEPSNSSLFGNNPQVDITVESVSTTRRLDAPNENTQPIVKTSSEQATGVPTRDLAGTLASMRKRAMANAFPTWQTTLQEKTVASAASTSVYAHTPTRVG